VFRWWTPEAAPVATALWDPREVRVADAAVQRAGNRDQGAWPTGTDNGLGHVAVRVVCTDIVRT